MTATTTIPVYFAPGWCEDGRLWGFGIDCAVPPSETSFLWRLYIRRVEGGVLFQHVFPSDVGCCCRYVFDAPIIGRLEFFPSDTRIELVVENSFKLSAAEVPASPPAPPKKKIPWEFLGPPPR